MAENINPNPKNSGKNYLLRYLLIGAIGVFVTVASLLLVNSIAEWDAPRKSTRNQKHRAYVRAINQFQELYYLKHRRFASSLEELGIKTHTEMEDIGSYTFLTVNFHQAVFNYAIPTDKNLRVYVCGVFVNKGFKENESPTSSILCRADGLEIREVEPPINAKTCGAKTSEIERQ